MNPRTSIAPKWLAVLYDDHCGICSRVRLWLEKQPAFVPLRLVPLHSPGLETLFPGIGAFGPEEKLVVVADNGLVWRGDSAWITLLWSLRGGRELAFQLASPALRPLAAGIVAAVSRNRIRLSRWLGLDPLRLRAEPCRQGTCAVDRGELPAGKP